MNAIITSVKLRNYFSWALLILVFTLPISQFVSARMLVILSLFSLFISNNQEKGVVRFIRNSWDIGLYLLVLIIGILYSENMTTGLKVLETNLSFLAMAIIFSKVIDEDEDGILLSRIYYSFSLGLCIACLICLVNAFLVYNRTGNVQSFFFYSLTDILLFQPTYFAYYLIFAITIGLYLLYYQKDAKLIIAKSAGILFFFLVLMLTGGQTAFISILLIFAFFILKFLIEEKSKIKRVATGLVGSMLIGIFLTTILVKGEREGLLSDSWDRLVLWESAIDAIPNPFFGVGTGDYKAVLNQYYTDHGMTKFASESYNSHNQFIQILFSNGVLGILAIILMIARPLYLSYKNENILGILALFPFLIYSMTEVFLGRYQGVVFFALVHQLFIAQLKPKKTFVLTKPS